MSQPINEKMKTTLLVAALMLSLSFRVSAPPVDLYDLSACMDNFPVRAISTLERAGFRVDMGDTTTDLILIIMESTVNSRVDAEAMILGNKMDGNFYVGITLQPQLMGVFNRMYLSASNGTHAYKGRFKTDDGDNIDFYKVRNAYMGFTMDRKYVSRIGIHNRQSFRAIYGLE